MKYKPIASVRIESTPISLGWDISPLQCQRAEERQRRHEDHCRVELFPALTRRYLNKHGASFPLSSEEKIDQLADKFDQLRDKIDQQEQTREKILETMEKIYHAVQTNGAVLHSQVSQHNGVADPQLDKNVQTPSGEKSADF